MLWKHHIVALCLLVSLKDKISRNLSSNAYATISFFLFAWIFYIEFESQRLLQSIFI